MDDRYLLVVTMAATLCGCVAGAKQIGDETDSDSASGSAGSDDSSESSAMTTGGDGECAAAMTPDACAIASEQRPPDSSCAWIDVETITASPDECAFGPQQGRCIESNYFGDGCIFKPACGVEGEPEVYYRDVGGGQHEVFTASACGYSFEGWSQCAWGPDGLEGDVLACNCVCEPGPEALPPNFWMEFETAGGCGDVYLYARNAADSLGLALHVDQQLAAQATDPGGEVVDVEIPAVDADRFELRVGTAVTSLECTDFAEQDPVIDARWTATGGTIAIHIEPGDAPVATVTITDATFVNDVSGGMETIDSFTWDGVTVGWLPG